MTPSSPPSPSPWMAPPSPPVAAFELVTLSVAIGSSVLFVLFGCVCFLVVSGRSLRARQNARMIGRQVVRVDEMPYATKEFTFSSLLGRREQ